MNALRFMFITGQGFMERYAHEYIKRFNKHIFNMKINITEIEVLHGLLFMKRRHKFRKDC